MKQTAPAKNVFADRVYLFAGIWGLILCTPGVFGERWTSQNVPPPITHPEYFYGFTICAIAWQIMFVLMSRDAQRFRSLMPATIVEKFGYAAAIIALFAFHRIATWYFWLSMTDLVWGVLFIAAYRRTRTTARS